MPNHGFALSSGNGGYSISAPARYSPNSIVTITVSGSSDFKGILLVVVNSGGSKIGTWSNVPSGFQLVCSNTGMTHTNNNDKSSALFSFVVPSSSGIGTLSIRATIVKVQSTFYQLTSTMEEIVSTATPTTATSPSLTTLSPTSDDPSQSPTSSLETTTIITTSATSTASTSVALSSHSVSPSTASSTNGVVSTSSFTNSPYVSSTSSLLTGALTTTVVSSTPTSLATSSIPNVVYFYFLCPSGNPRFVMGSDVVIRWNSSGY